MTQLAPGAAPADAHPKLPAARPPGAGKRAPIVRAARAIAVAPIRFYRRFLSPLKPPMCRFSPTCSAYAQEAIQRHGVFRGGLMATWRVLRCQPFARGGYDPVPGTAPRCDHEPTPEPRDAP